MDDAQGNVKRKRPKIPDHVQRELWARAAGRCEFKGCNKLLYKDVLTQKKDNLSTISHIVAFSSDGPRGHEEDSKRLEKDISNLMLTCRDHGKIIDSHQYVKEYPVELLRAHKKEHEQRIKVLTSIQDGARTHVLVLQVPIAGRGFTIDPVQLHQAVLPRYPAEENPLVIDLSELAVPEDSPHFWSFTSSTITSRFNDLLADGIRKGRVNHLSVFGLAPIPLLMHLGSLIGNIVPTVLYQRHRDSQSWTWQNEDVELEGLFSVLKPTSCTHGGDIALILSVSGRVDREKVAAALGKDVAVFEIIAVDPGFYFLKSERRLWQFGNVYRKVLAGIREQFGHDCTVHMFPAVPAPVAIECGRSLMKKCDPPIQVYDLLPGKGFRSALAFLSTSC